jgi:hypothetical protein
MRFEVFTALTIQLMNFYNKDSGSKFFHNHIQDYSVITQKDCNLKFGNMDWFRTEPNGDKASHFMIQNILLR